MNMNSIVIRPWEDDFAEDFIRLSIEWLEKYVRVEPADEAVLYHPHEAILDVGGMIFFARDGARNIGTVSMIPTEAGEYELAKLAVTEACKGKGVGALLMRAALDFAKARNAKRVFLLTNRKLVPAVRLYEKFGFREAALEDNDYESADLEMELILRSAETGGTNDFSCDEGTERL